jgi:hypothetical protein
MNLDLSTAAFTVAALGLMAAFDVIPGTGTSAVIPLLATGKVLFLGQPVEPIGFRHWWR